MKNLTWQNPEQLFVAQELINKVKSKCCGIKDYLSLIDIDFAKQQFQILKKYLKQTIPFITGIKEYHSEKCLFGFDIDAGPIVFGFSPSGTAFSVGAATMCNDSKFRKQLLRTAEIACSTVSYNGKSHYLLANIAFVGEAIMLAMRTSQ